MVHCRKWKRIYRFIKSSGAVSYYTIYFVIDETLTIIPGEYFKIGDTFYEFDNYDELWDKFIVFNSTK